MYELLEAAMILAFIHAVGIKRARPNGCTTSRVVDTDGSGGLPRAQRGVRRTTAQQWRRHCSGKQDSSREAATL